MNGVYWDVRVYDGKLSLGLYETGVAGENGRFRTVLTNITPKFADYLVQYNLTGDSR